MRGTLLTLAVVLVVLAASASRAPASESVEALLFHAGTPTELRALLLAHAATDPDSAERGEALYYAGVSYQRDGWGDSARVCLEAAVSLRGQVPEREALADLLFQRRAPGDSRRALEVLGPCDALPHSSSLFAIADTRGRQAWALYLDGKSDSALTLMSSRQHWLLHPLNPLQREWRYRLGVLELDRGDLQQSLQLLASLAVDSRFQDGDVLRDLKDAADRAQVTTALETSMKQQRRALDDDDRILLDSLRARRVSTAASDGFPLSGVVFAPDGPRRARTALVLVPPDLPVDAFDSLAVGLRRAGYAVMLLEVRGWGWSVDKSCPLPETWRGRETRIQSQVAADVVPALRALAHATPVDTTRYLLVGIGITAAIAVEAAGVDSRARLLMLIAPDPSPVERGIMRARLTRLKQPVFFQIPAEDSQTLPVAEALYEAIDPRASRIAESDRIGHGPMVFRHDPGALPRLLRWLDDSWPPPAGRSPRH